MLDSLALLRAMNGIHEEDVIMAGNMIFHEQKAKHFKTNRILTLALAAALILALGATAYAIYRGSMHARVPEKGTTEYHLLSGTDSEGPAELLHVDFAKTKLALSFDVPADGLFPVMRAAGLPGEESGWRKESFYEMLDKAQYFGLPWEMKLLSPDQVQINPEQIPEDRLREADMDAETAKSWYTNYLYRGPGGELLRIDLYGGYRLHGKEVILGAFAPEDTKAEAVKEGTFGEYELVEVRMSYPDGSAHKHLFLFHPEKYWLLQISCTDDLADFSALEKLAEGIEIRKTGLSAKSYEDKVDYILADLAWG